MRGCRDCGLVQRREHLGAHFGLTPALSAHEKRDRLGRVNLVCHLLENAASEQGARMTAMDNATRNAGDMIDRLTMNYNRTRQAVITKELIEIISGAEAL